VVHGQPRTPNNGIGQSATTRVDMRHRGQTFDGGAGTHHRGNHAGHTDIGKVVRGHGAAPIYDRVYLLREGDARTPCLSVHAFILYLGCSTYLTEVLERGLADLQSPLSQLNRFLCMLVHGLIFQSVHNYPLSKTSTSSDLLSRSGPTCTVAGYVRSEGNSPSLSRQASLPHHMPFTVTA